MNKEEIDEWLDNEYGMSYTRLEELHDYFFEKYTDQKEEIERLNNIINEIEKYAGLGEVNWEDKYQDIMLSSKGLLKRIKELKGDSSN